VGLCTASAGSFTGTRLNFGHENCHDIDRQRRRSCGTNRLKGGARGRTRTPGHIIAMDARPAGVSAPGQHAGTDRSLDTTVTAGGRGSENRRRPRSWRVRNVATRNKLGQLGSSGALPGPFAGWGPQEGRFLDSWILCNIRQQRIAIGPGDRRVGGTGRRPSSCRRDATLGKFGRSCGGPCGMQGPALPVGTILSRGFRSRGHEISVTHAGSSKD